MGCCQPTEPETSTFHYVIVDLRYRRPIISITPWNPPITACASCADQPQCGIEITNVEVTLQEQDETCTVLLVRYEVDDSTFEIEVVRTLLWSYTELTDELHRTASFILTEITAEGNTYTQSYSLSYLAQHEDYNLTIDTYLEPLTSDTYNRSLTVINYIPADKSVESVELVEFHSSVTLSEQYAVLGKVAQEVGKIYKKSGDEPLAQLAQGYRTMKKEAKHLSRLVRTQFLEYDREILHTTGVLMDGWLECVLAGAVCGAAIVAVIGCVLAGPGLIGCLAAALGMSWEAIIASIATGAGIIFSCVYACCCIGYNPCCDML